MQVQNIQINHLNEPRGFQLSTPLKISAELKTDANNVKSVERRLQITAQDQLVYDSQWENETNLLFEVPITLQPRTIYTVKIRVRANQQEADHQSWFETGYLNETLRGKWIADSSKKRHSVIFHRHFKSGEIAKARLYIAALGVYEAYLDGQKVGNEYLTPGFTDYRYYVQRATYDVTDLLRHGQEHDLQIMVADGWYRGCLGLKKHGGLPNNYGDTLMAVADLRITDSASQETLVATDNNWDLQQSPVIHSGIYYGEDLDQTVSARSLGPVQVTKPVSRYVKDRLSMPIKAHEVFPAKLIVTPRGEQVLDFGQNMAGWVIFTDDLAQDQKISLQFGEIMQDGEFYRDNLRSARAEFTYVSDGRNHLVRPHFTYFGFRYVKVTGIKQVKPQNFKAVALYSSMPATGWLKTDNQTVNRLFENVQWGQRSNFVDVPTDCPQRDERLGWTGDAAVFFRTASYNMDTYEFFKKYSYDMAIEQSKLAGKLPLYVPSLGETDGGKAVWSDAAVIIPWQAYQRTGDTAILHQNIGAMMSWVDWIHERAQSQGNEYLWLGDDQLGDWLALDTEDIMHLKGKTSDDLIASAFYYYSASLVARATQILSMKHESQYYHQLAKLIKQAFIDEFFTKSGRTLANTQTGLAICLYFGLYPAKSHHRLVKLLVNAVEKNHNHLNTGFVGTPLLLPVLSQNGEHELAVRLFLNDDFPSWLYEVKHGATTIWERWNSVDEQGHIAKNGMNSLNHYSSGAVMQWGYEELLGLHQHGNDVTWQPRLTPAFKEVHGQVALPVGLLKASWKIENPQRVRLEIEVPFGTRVKLKLPQARALQSKGSVDLSQALPNGHYIVLVDLTESLVQTFDVHTPLKDYCQLPDLAKKLDSQVPFWNFLMLPDNLPHFKDFSLYQLNAEMRGIGFTPLNDTQLAAINNIFKTYSLEKLQEVKS